MRPVVFSQFEVCGILSSLQCFDTVGWVTGWASGLQKKTCATFSQMFCKTVVKTKVTVVTGMKNLTQLDRHDIHLKASFSAQPRLDQSVF